MEKLLRYLINTLGGLVGAETLFGLRRYPLVVRLLRLFYNRWPEGSVVTISRGRAKGMQWRRYHDADNAFWIGIYEPEMQEAIASRLGPGRVFFDVGANVGFFSLIASRLVGAGGEVCAFEPMPDVGDVLEEQIALNKLDNTTVIRSAVSDREGTASFQVGGYKTTGKLAEGEAPDAITVAVTTLDAFCSGRRPPDVLKVDVEGAEGAALRGAGGLLSSGHRPIWIIEIHGEQPGREVRDALAGFGYHFYDLAGALVTGSLFRAHHVVAQPE